MKNTKNKKKNYQVSTHNFLKERKSGSCLTKISLNYTLYKITWCIFSYEKKEKSFQSIIVNEELYHNKPNNNSLYLLYFIFYLA